MKVVLATLGRFHMFALARELDKRGDLVRIFSGFPWSALAREKIPRGKVTTFPYVRPMMMLPMKLGLTMPEKIDQFLHLESTKSLDWFVSRNLPDCDIYVGHEGVGARAGKIAKANGASYVYDRGCTHSVFRDQLLQEEYDLQGIPRIPQSRKIIELEMAQYDQADAIVVPSEFAWRSFLAHGVSPNKLFKVPYGVDTSQFHYVGQPSDEFFEILFVGGISPRKGIKYLIDAFNRLDVGSKRLTLAGSLAPELANLPRLLQAKQIRFLGPRPQTEIRQLMSKAHVMVLPSIEEGLALVQAEALACGCPVIATKNTGAEDIFSDGVEGYIVPIRDFNAIAERLTRLWEDKGERAKLSLAARQRVKHMNGWGDYGDKMIATYSQVRRGAARSGIDR